MTPYEVYFYSSGVVEDHWGPKDLGLNKVTAMIGYGLGGFLSFALMIVSAVHALLSSPAQTTGTRDGSNRGSTKARSRQASYG